MDLHLRDKDLFDIITLLLIYLFIYLVCLYVFAAFICLFV